MALNYQSLFSTRYMSHNRHAILEMSSTPCPSVGSGSLGKSFKHRLWVFCKCTAPSSVQLGCRSPKSYVQHLGNIKRPLFLTVYWF